jgi:hypothetical protein
MPCACDDSSHTFSYGSSSSSSSSSSSLSSSLGSSSCSSSSSSKCPNVYSTSSCESSSSSCNDCRNNCNCECLPKDCVQCEKPDSRLCKRLNSQYKRCKDVLYANKKTKTSMEYLSEKLVNVQPLLKLRDVTKYSVENNIDFIECFVDTVFCVLRKNKLLGGLKFSDCKVKNNDECRVSDRVYLIKVKFHNNGKTCCRTYALNFNWTQLTGNYLNSYNGVLNKVIGQIADVVDELDAQNTSPFLCC